MTKKFNAEFIRELANILDETNLTEIEVEDQGLSVRVAREVTQVVNASVAPVPVAHAPVASVPEASPAASAGDDLKDAITSPMVGTVYLQPEPGSPSFVKIGDQVSQGQTLLIIEAMKVMNPLVSPKSGTVKQILVSDSQPVEFGEPLFVIDA